MDPRQKERNFNSNDGCATFRMIVSLKKLHVLGHVAAQRRVGNASDVGQQLLRRWRSSLARRRVAHAGDGQSEEA